MSINYTGLPESLRDGMRLYLEHGVPPGDFLEAVLCNNLIGAFMCADPDNRRALFGIVQWVYNDAPRNSWGSPYSYRTWRKARLEEQNDKAVRA